jgi:hypothetical protein
MTTNVPQDVLEDAKAAGFVIFQSTDGSEGIETFDDGENITDDLLKFLELRAHRQKGSEPVYTNTNHGFVMTDRNFTVSGDGYIQDNNFDYDAGLTISGDFSEGDKAKYTQMICDALNSYTTPPPPTLDFAAGMMKAVEVAKQYGERYGSWVVGSVCKDILAAIPKESADALKEYVRGKCMEVARLVADEDDYIEPELQEIVNSVLEGKS